MTLLSGDPIGQFKSGDKGVQVLLVGVLVRGVLVRGVLRRIILAMEIVSRSHNHHFLRGTLFSEPRIPCLIGLLPLLAHLT